jgi:hypothetical protein
LDAAPHLFRSHVSHWRRFGVLRVIIGMNGSLGVGGHLEGHGTEHQRHQDLAGTRDRPV